MPASTNVIVEFKHLGGSALPDVATSKTACRCLLHGPYNKKCTAIVLFLTSQRPYVGEAGAVTNVHHMLLLFLTFSAVVANPKKLLYTVANPVCGLLNRGKKRKKKKEKVWQRPPPLARCSFGEKEKKKSRDASTYLGATQVGVTQVVSVRLASVQGFLRLVS